MMDGDEKKGMATICHHNIHESQYKPKEWFDLPFRPYSVQRQMMNFTGEGLRAVGVSAKPIIAVEVPTGCGKTMALLSSVLQFQQETRRMEKKEAETYFKQRYSASCHEKDNLKYGKNNAQSLDPWSISPEFKALFRDRNAPQPGTKRARQFTDESKSSELRRRFIPPACTIFYATRTHAQLQQVTRELRRLATAFKEAKIKAPSSTCPLRMNILASRDHYCINTKLQQAKGKGALPHEGNNLGEVCDKLVALQQCPCVEKYDVLACSALDGCGVGFHRGEPVWDIEDLVTEGVRQEKCPYYAARDLVFYADISLCTYQYLLDPIIRHESRFEGAIRNNSIVVFDEAHNIPSVCEEALSICSSISAIKEFISSLEPMVAPSEEMTTALSYPRTFQLKDGYTLVDIFTFLHLLFRGLESFFLELQMVNQKMDNPTVEKERRFVYGNDLVSHVHTVIRGWFHKRQQDREIEQDHDKNGPHIAKNQKKFAKKTNDEHGCGWFSLFREAYAIIFSLGVTFNPFDLPLHALAGLKRWLLILRFLFQKPQAFALHVQEEQNDERSAGGKSFHRLIGESDLICEVRCLDGSLAFAYLLRSTFRVILASGTLAPFPQLSLSLGISPPMWNCFEGQHVVPKENYVVQVLVETNRKTPLRCTYGSISSESFIQEIAETVFQIVCKSVKKGGVVVMVPNYKVLHNLHKALRHVIEHPVHQPSGEQYVSVLTTTTVFTEPKQSAELRDVLDYFKMISKHQAAVFIGVYRGKSGEGLDFTDDMARMVICVGLPLRPVFSWSVLAKRVFSGEEWYVTDAVCAVNQALGRCLRHANDYGAILLFDDRYREEYMQEKLSKWCREVVSVHESIDEVVERLKAKYAEWVLSVDSSNVNESQVDSASDVVSSLIRCRTNDKRSKAAGLMPVFGEPMSEHTNDKIEVERLKLTRRVVEKSGDTKKEVSLRMHPLSSTAVKLLYEQVDDTKEVNASSLRQAIETLEADFFVESSDNTSNK